jgi:hypothetical protein
VPQRTAAGLDIAQPGLDLCDCRPRRLPQLAARLRAVSMGQQRLHRRNRADPPEPARRRHFQTVGRQPEELQQHRLTRRVIDFGKPLGRLGRQLRLCQPAAAALDEGKGRQSY